MAGAAASSHADPRPLTAKQQRFVSEYLIDSNGTQAAIRAGYSAKTAQEQASRLLSQVMVAAAVADGRKSLERSTIADATERREILSRALRAEEDSGKLAKVADVLNKMDGLYVTKIGDPDGKPLIPPGGVVFVVREQAGATNRA